MPSSIRLMLQRLAAPRTRLPEWIAPQLATLVEKTPDGDQWIHETKFDGYRLIVRINGADVRIFTRNHNDWTDKFRQFVPALKALGLQNAFLDGEVAAVDEHGRTHFQTLQNSLKGRSSATLVLFLFDIMHCNGFDLRKVQLVDRKKLLEQILKKSKSKQLSFSSHLQGRGQEIFQAACDTQLEGIISKRRDSPYLSARTQYWLKSKCVNEEEFVIIGFVSSTLGKTFVGALLLGTRIGKQKSLTYCGKVGTGFDTDDRQRLYKKCLALQRPTPAVSPSKLLPRKGVVWVEPKLVAQIKFGERTQEGLLRVPVFLGLREDKTSSQVRTEVPKKSMKGKTSMKGKKK